AHEENGRPKVPVKAGDLCGLLSRLRFLGAGPTVETSGFLNAPGGHAAAEKRHSALAIDENKIHDPLLNVPHPSRRIPVKVDTRLSELFQVRDGYADASSGAPSRPSPNYPPWPSPLVPTSRPSTCRNCGAPFDPDEGRCRWCRALLTPPKAAHHPRPHWPTYGTSPVQKSTPRFSLSRVVIATAVALAGLGAASAAM